MKSASISWKLCWRKRMYFPLCLQRLPCIPCTVGFVSLGFGVEYTISTNMRCAPYHSHGVGQVASCLLASLSPCRKWQWQCLHLLQGPCSWVIKCTQSTECTCWGHAVVFICSLGQWWWAYGMGGVFINTIV